MRCYFCGEDTPDVEVCVDPFVQDVCSEELHIPICPGCYGMRCDKV